MSRNKENNAYPCKPQFYYIKVGFKGVKIIYACFRDGLRLSILGKHFRDGILFIFFFTIFFFSKTCFDSPCKLSSKTSWFAQLIRALRKHAYSNTLEILPPKKWKFSYNFFYIFHISAQSIDCGYSLEPPRRGGSNKYPQFMFWAEIRKIMYTPVNPSFTI